MKRPNLYLVMIAVVLISLIGLASSARAAPQATYTLVQSYIGPGGNGSAGIYSVASSIGQPAAGEENSDTQNLDGRFWGGGGIGPVQNDNHSFFPSHFQ